MDSAEFDRFADEYDGMLRKTIAITGEGPEFFHEYKIKVLRRVADGNAIRAAGILDFGSGIGNSTPYFRRYFPGVKLSGADVSQRSLDVAETRFPGASTGLQITDRRIPAPDGAFDIAFSACVFHHIPHDEHILWLGELRRVTRPGGMVGIFEHNPLNPITVRAVNTCPFDENAHLIRAKAMLERYRSAGWAIPTIRYHLFFPHVLSGMRFMEPYLEKVPVGGQYSVTAINPG